jgi:cell division protein FtsL
VSTRLALGGLVIALVGACGLYIMKDRVNRLEGELRRQQAMIAAEQTRLHRLRAEWAMLEQPGRLARLAAAHLGLQPAHPTQIMAIDDLPRRAELQVADRSLPALLPSGAGVVLRFKPRRLSLPLVSMAEVAQRDP